MDSTLSDAYAEVSYILDILGEEYKNKVPKKILNLFKNKKNDNYKVDIDLSNGIDKINISRTALIIISILNLKYWEPIESEKKRLKKIYDKNEQIYQNKINEYKNNDWLKKKEKHESINENIEVKEKSLIVKEKTSIYDKFKNFIKKLFNK